MAASTPPNPELLDSDRTSDPIGAASAKAKVVEDALKQAREGFAELEALLGQVAKAHPKKADIMAEMRITLVKSEQGLGQYSLIPLLIDALLKSRD